MEISYRSVDLNNLKEMEEIASIDMTIPAKFDSFFTINKKTISERLEQLLNFKDEDFFEAAISSSGKIVAYHALTQFKTPHGLMAADVHTLWVDPVFRKKGIAKTLKARGEAWAKARNLHHISTFVNAKNTKMLSINENGPPCLAGHAFLWD